MEAPRNPARTHRTRLARLGAMLLAALGALGACADDAIVAPPERVPVAAVRVGPAEHTLEIGQTVRLAATPLAASGDELDGRAIAWSSEHEGTATVDQTGLVTAHAAGTIRIVAASEGKSGAARITVRGPDDPPPPPAAAPVLGSLYPAQIQAGWSNFTLTLTGEGFTAASRVLWNGQLRETRFVSASELRMTVYASDVALPATAVVAVETPAPGGGTSATVTFRIVAVAVASVTVSTPAGAAWTWTELALPMHATLRDLAGRELTGRDVLWSSADASIARVSPAGILTGASPGQTTLTATVDGVAGSTPVDVYAAPSYDLIFDAGLDAARQLLVWSPGTGAALRLLPLGMPAYDPSPAPDGRRIAFTGVDPSGNVDLWLVNGDGSGLTRLTTHAAVDDQPAWSPDGRTIAFRSTRSGRSDIWVVDAETREARQLTGATSSGDYTWPETADAWPAWSPDGRHLVYSAGPVADADLWIMRADGSDKRRLTSGAEIDLDPTWSPDGAVITFRRERGPAVQIVSVLAANGQQVIHTSYPGAGWSPAYSQDGRWLTYSAPQVGAQPALMVMPANGQHGPRGIIEWGVDVVGRNAAWMRRP